ncbi:MAG: hypothetical protein QOH91_2914, partial [Mycobacterium sp.]|nr:hypothetical protein [Mycobacterium sp.]
MDGTPFGRYRLVELVGRGGMGEVWRAFDTMTERVVALKVLPAQLANDEVFQQRFRREARAAAGINEPHVVPIHDFGEIEGRLYVTMRLIEGRNLQSILTTGPLQPDRAVHIIGQVASALNAAHRIDLVHRDVKPSNILVAEDDFAYLIDFGIARATGETKLTNTGSVIGTWAYLAPERLTTGEADHRSDIYALTCVMHECLTGSQPFPGDSLEMQIGGHLTQPPPRPSALRAGLPAELDAVVAKGMAKNPDERYATTRELASAARAAISTPRTEPQPMWPTQPAPHPQGGGWSTAPTQFGSPSGPVQSGPPSGPIWSGPPSGPIQSGPPSGPIWSGPPSGPMHFGAPSGATFARPPSGPPGADQPRRKRHRLAWAAAAAAIAIIVTVVLVMVFTNRGDENQEAIPSDMPNTQPFTGMYRADFGPSTTNGKLDDGATPSTGQWAVRSTCRSNNCVATATATGGPTLQSGFAFDDIGGQWVAVEASSVKAAPSGVTGFKGCNFPAEY